MPPSIRRTARLLWPLLLVPGSGCLTRALWELDDPVRRVVLSERAIDAAIVVTVDEVRSALEVDAQRSDRAELPAASGVSRPRSTWRLWPGDGADEALAVLSGLAEFELDWIELRVVRETSADEVVESRAELQLEGRPIRASFATRVDLATLSPGLRAALQPISGADYRLDYTLPPETPELLVECTRRLRAVDLRDWLPDPVPASPSEPDGDPRRLAGFAWLDDAHRLVSDRARWPAALRELEFGDQDLSERLAALRSLRVLVEVVGGGGREYYLLRPDLVWLWSRLVADEHGARHLSSWQSEPLAAPPPGERSLRVLGHGMMRLTFREVGYERSSWPHIALKVVLTPLTVAVDGVTLLLGAWLLGDDC